MEKNRRTPAEPEERAEGEGHFLLNIGKTLFLVAVLVAAWFVLEWLMGAK